MQAIIDMINAVCQEIAADELLARIDDQYMEMIAELHFEYEEMCRSWDDRNFEDTFNY